MTRKLQRWAAATLAVSVSVSGCAASSALGQAPDARPHEALTVRGAEPEGGSLLRPLTKWLPGGDEQPKPKPTPRAARPSASSKPLSAEDLEQSKLALAQLAERRGSAEEAEKLFRSVLEKNPRQPLAHHRLGVLSAKRGDYAAADKHFEAALAQTPGNVDLLNDRGYCLFLQHRLEEAESYCRKAHELAPLNASACNNLALILGEQGRIQESWALFKRAGSEAQAHANIAYVYTRWGDLEKAESHFSQALALDSSIRPAAEALIQVEKTKSRLQTLAARKGAQAPQSKTGPDSTAPLPPESQANAAESAAPPPPAKSESQRLATTSTKPASRRDPLLEASLAPAPEGAAEPILPTAGERANHPHAKEPSAAKEARTTVPADHGAAPPTVVVKSPRVVDEPESPSPFAQELVVAQQAPPAAPRRAVDEPPAASSERTVFAQKSRQTGGNLWLERGDFSVSQPLAQSPATAGQGDFSASNLHQPEKATAARGVEPWRDDLSPRSTPLAVSHASSDEATLRWGGGMPTKAEQTKRQSLILLGDGAPPRAPVRDFRRDGGDDDQAPRPALGAHGEGLAGTALDDEPLPLIRPGVEPAFVPAPVLYGRSEAPQQASPHASAEASATPHVAAAPAVHGPAPAHQPRDEVMAASTFQEAPIITPEQWRAQQAGKTQPFTTDLFPTARPTWTPSQAQPQPLTPPPSAKPVIR